MLISNKLTIATWNTNGPTRNRSKDAHLAAIQFDVAAVQECEASPLGTQFNAISIPFNHGSGERCLAILSRHRLSPATGAPECSVAAYVDGPTGGFLFVSVWVKPITTGAGVYKYVRRLPPIFDWAMKEAGSLPFVIAGDFNCNAAFRLGRGSEFGRLAESWKDSHGIASAWHQRSKMPMGVGEEPTWRSKMNRSTPEFMIDYIFVPIKWHVETVQVLEPHGSDHRPVVAEVRVH